MKRERRIYRQNVALPVYLRAYDTVADATWFISRYINNVNTIRPHASLGCKTPDNIHAIAPAEELLKAS